jgi:hypothetical protein
VDCGFSKRFLNDYPRTGSVRHSDAPRYPTTTRHWSDDQSDLAVMSQYGFVPMQVDFDGVASDARTDRWVSVSVLGGR